MPFYFRPSISALLFPDLVLDRFQFPAGIGPLALTGEFAIPLEMLADAVDPRVRTLRRYCRLRLCLWCLHLFGRGFRGPRGASFIICYGMIIFLLWLKYLSFTILLGGALLLNCVSKGYLALASDCFNSQS